MSNRRTKPQLLQRIAAIPAMERGKLSAYSFEERSGAAGPYYQLQHGRKGQNHTRYVPADELVGWLLQQAAERADARYQPKPGESRKGRETLRVQCIFGTFELSRDYYYHAGKEHPDYQTQLRRWAKLLLKDKVPALIDQTRKQGVGKPQAEAVEKELGYFVRNLSRMQYGTFRAKGYFIGSGVVEAGCKTVIGSRCKQSGMFWSEAGAENILALRCIQTSHRSEELWKHRLDARAAQNNPLPLAA